jgi:hypothetical protein
MQKVLTFSQVDKDRWYTYGAQHCYNTYVASHVKKHGNIHPVEQRNATETNHGEHCVFES